MPADALALTLAAAALHAGWNLLIARAGDTDGALAAAVLFAVAVFAPVAVPAPRPVKVVYPRRVYRFPY